MKFKEIEEKAKKVQKLNTIEERAVFYKYASKVPDNGLIVDIGTAQGGSAFIFALSSKPSVKVYTIDPSQNEKFIFLRKEWGLEEKIVFLHQTSQDAAKGWDKEIDMLFIDGSHSYSGVKNDFLWFGSHVKKGGIVAFHDYYYYGAIGKAVDEIVASGAVEKVEIVDSLYQKERRTGLYISKIIRK
jgi:predicted O-methyltransferase YrrM